MRASYQPERFRVPEFAEPTFKAVRQTLFQQPLLCVKGLVRRFFSPITYGGATAQGFTSGPIDLLRT